MRSISPHQLLKMLYLHNLLIKNRKIQNYPILRQLIVILKRNFETMDNMYLHVILYYLVATRIEEQIIFLHQVVSTATIQYKLDPLIATRSLLCYASNNLGYTYTHALQYTIRFHTIQHDVISSRKGTVLVYRISAFTPDILFVCNSIIWI